MHTQVGLSKGYAEFFLWLFPVVLLQQLYRIGRFSQLNQGAGTNQSCIVVGGIETGDLLAGTYHIPLVAALQRFIDCTQSTF